MTLYNLYNTWYDVHRGDDPIFVLLCRGLLQHIDIKKLTWEDTIKYRQLYDSIRYAMEDGLNDYQQY